MMLLPDLALRPTSLGEAIDAARKAAAASTTSAASDLLCNYKGINTQPVVISLRHVPEPRAATADASAAE
jgi:hypothetical protein